MALPEGYPWRFGLFLMGYYMSNAVFQGFFTLYLKDHGMSNAMVGIVMAMVPVVAVMTQPVLGLMGDRARDRRSLLRGIIVIAALLVMCFRFSAQVWYVFAVIALFATCFPAIQPMGDSIIMESLNETRAPFGPIRLCATFAFALMSFMFGKFLGADKTPVLYATAALLGITLLTTFALPRAPGKQSHERIMMGRLLRDRTLIRLLVFVAVQHVAMGYFYTFFPVHFVEIQGGNDALLGICYVISSISELPFLIFSDRVFARLGVGRLLIISCAMLITRNVLLGCLSDVYAVMATQLLHSWGFIVMTVAMSRYVSLTVPKELRASGQMLLSVVGFGIARTLSTAAGGFMTGVIGIRGGFFVCAGLCAAAMLVFAPGFLKAPPLNGGLR